jgi:hypothetical protein
MSVLCCGAEGFEKVFIRSRTSHEKRIEIRNRKCSVSLKFSIFPYLSDFEWQLAIRNQTWGQEIRGLGG